MILINYLELEVRLNANNEPAANNTEAMIVAKPELDCSPVSGKAFVVWASLVWVDCVLFSWVETSLSVVAVVVLLFVAAWLLSVLCVLFGASIVNTLFASLGVWASIRPSL